VSPHGDEGPLAIEVASGRSVELPAGSHPQLGVAFTRRS
jgi:hypothetical protein